MSQNFRRKGIGHWLSRHPFIILALPLGLVGYFVYGGMFWNAWVSFTNWRGLTPTYAFYGFQNYSRLFGSAVFAVALKNTLLLFLTIPVCIVVGFILAVLLDQNIRGTGIFRNLLLLPYALSFVVTGTIWAWMYNPSKGILNALLRQIGLARWQGMWHTSQETVMYAIVLALVWQFSGYAALVLLAGIRSVPEVQIKAALLEGATRFRIYRKIIVPQLKGAVMTVVIVIMMYALRAFDFIWVLTGGGPGYASHTLSIMMYKEAFQATRFAYAAAIANVLLGLTLILVLPYLYWMHRRAGQ
ncbi:MAG: sugar ABC transporter permease [Candidatus Bipolaricaulota bacterium]|nr:sugar ABC transporter permease [Candidatus Bipolaricaulota bacterium]MDW8151701.1 sugar ABC transporter permease [Candidatus Bipolaricaulota bacterium]